MFFGNKRIIRAIAAIIAIIMVFAMLASAIAPMVMN